MILPLISNGEDLLENQLKSERFSFSLQVGMGDATGVAIEQIKNGLQDVINKSLDRADYSLAKAAIQALGAIDAWKEANLDLLETAFDQLDKKSRNLFTNMSVLINQANELVTNNLETSRQIVENTNQITESIPGSGKRSFILRYFPSVLSPLIADSVLITFRGVNLEKAQIGVTLPDNTVRKVNIVGPQEVSFWLPISALPIDQSKHQVFELKVNHITRDGNTAIFWPKYRNVSRTILISSLPKQAATFALTGIRSFENEERIIYTADMGRFSGTNTSVEKIANLANGYKWDLRGGVSSHQNFRIVSTGRGEAGRCQEIIWNGSNEHGIIGRARLDRIRQVRFPDVRYSDGYKHCGIEGPIYRFISTTAGLEPISGQLFWGQDEIIELPTDISEFTLSIKSFTGEDKIITNNYSDEFLSVSKERSRLIIRTKIPTDLIK
ncbi:hypothetical protein GCM10009122_22700 [Fulvivirga kasyanovii]